MRFRHRSSGSGLIQLIISLVLSSIIIFGVSKIMISVFKASIQVRSLQSFENMKLNIKLALRGCDYDFQHADESTITFSSSKKKKKRIKVAFDRITKQGVSIVKVGEQLSGGLTVNTLKLIDTKVPPETVTVDNVDFTKYLVRLKFDTKTIDGKVIRVFDPPIHLAIFTDQTNNFVACAKPPT